MGLGLAHELEQSSHLMQGIKFRRLISEGLGIPGCRDTLYAKLVNFDPFCQLNSFSLCSAVPLNA